MRNREEALQTSPPLLPHCCSAQWQSRNCSWLLGSRGAGLAAVSPPPPDVPPAAPSVPALFLPPSPIPAFHCLLSLHPFLAPQAGGSLDLSLVPRAACALLPFPRGSF